MKRVTITCSNGPVELSESVEDLYSVSEKANSALKELRMGLPTWTAKETYNKVQVSLWIYDNIEVNAFCHYEDGQNYIALSVGLLTMLWKEAEEFVDQDNLGLVFKISEGNKDYFKDMLFFFMVNFTIAHEYGHIAHGHLKDRASENSIDERFSVVENISDEEKRTRNWNIQLREYDADSFAVAVQSMLFLQQWQDDVKANLANFDIMFIANYLCFRTFAENTGRDFSNYMTKNIDEYDHPHPGIRMYYSIILYSYWLIKLHGENEKVLAILESGSHAVAMINAKFSFRKIVIVLLGVVGISVGITLLGFYFKEPGLSFFTSDAIVNYMGDNGYTNSGDLSRFNARCELQESPSGLYPDKDV